MILPAAFVAFLIGMFLGALIVNRYIDAMIRNARRQGFLDGITKENARWLKAIGRTAVVKQQEAMASHPAKGES